MHGTRRGSTTAAGVQTTGATIHWASSYDILTGLMGLGVNTPNSRMICEMAGIKGGDKVLDLGCGTGNLTLTVETYTGLSGAACGLDASPQMIATARAKAKRRGSQAAYKLGLIEKIDYPEATFDVIVSRLVMHHLPEDLKRLGLAEMLRVLRPGGRLFLVDFSRPSNHILGHITSIFVGQHMAQTSVWDLPPMVQDAGFVDVASGPTRSAYMAFVSAKKPAQ
jgi:ubiquinone/menaquinone biosynthesis C-methylase UbiE